MTTTPSFFDVKEAYRRMDEAITAHVARFKERQLRRETRPEKVSA